MVERASSVERTIVGERVITKERTNSVERERKLAARLADFQNRSDEVAKYVDQLIERWRKHPETAPRPQRGSVYSDDDEMGADEAGMTMRHYVNSTMR